MHSDATRAILPPGTPLLVDINRAAELFGVSVRMLRILRAEHEDFPAGQLHGSTSNILFDVPRCYAWFARHLGTDAAN